MGGIRTLVHAQFLMKSSQQQLHHDLLLHQKSSRHQKWKLHQNQLVLLQSQKLPNLKHHHQLVRMVNGENVKNLLVSWVDQSTALSMSAFLPAMTDLIQMVHQKQNVSETLIRPFNGIKTLELAQSMMTAMMVTTNPLMKINQSKK